MDPTRRRSPLRLLAPVALIVFVLAALLVVVTSSVDDEPKGSSASEESSSDESSSSADKGEDSSSEGEGKLPQNTYTVQSGDSLAAIADKTGIKIEKLQELNPELDPQALITGQKIKLRE